MANRNFIGKYLYSMHAMPVMVTATASIGATGAVSSFVGSMVQTLARASTGVYTMTLQANTSFSRLYFASGSLQSPASGLSGVSTVEIQNAPNTTVAAPGAMVLTVKCLDAAGALVDPATGSALNLLAIVSNSSVIIDGE